MLLFFRVLLLITCFLSPLAIAKNQVLFYEPKLIKLNGTIITLKFPGAPNFESIKKGDAKEIGPYLVLNNPIDVESALKVQDNVNTPETNVKIIQLVVSNDKELKKLQNGNYVQLSGTLSHSLTGHHHARVLLEVNEIKLLGKRKIIRHKLGLTAEDQKFLAKQNLQN